MAHLQDSDLSAWDNQSSALLNELIQDMSWVITQSRGGNPCSPSSPSHCSVTRTRSSIDSPNMVTSLSQDCYSRSLLSRPLWKRNIQGWEFIIDGYLNSLYHGTRQKEKQTKDNTWKMLQRARTMGRNRLNCQFNFLAGNWPSLLRNITT